MLETRRMRARDMAEQAKYVLPKFYGEVVVKDGRDIGSVSIVWMPHDRRPFLCLQITDELRKAPVFLVKIGKRFIAAAMSTEGQLFTLEDKEEPTSRRFLEYLGFKPTGETIEGERVLTWQKS